MFHLHATRAGLMQCLISRRFPAITHVHATLGYSSDSTSLLTHMAVGHWYGAGSGQSELPFLHGLLTRALTRGSLALTGSHNHITRHLHGDTARRVLRALLPFQ